MMGFGGGFPGQGNPFSGGQGPLPFRQPQHPGNPNVNTSAMQARQFFNNQPGRPPGPPPQINGMPYGLAMMLPQIAQQMNQAPQAPQGMMPSGGAQFSFHGGRPFDMAQAGMFDRFMQQGVDPAQARAVAGQPYFMRETGAGRNR